MKKIALSFILLFTLPSCHHLISQNVNIIPNLYDIEIDSGKRRTVKVTVKDKRANQYLIGKRWQLLGGSITSSQDVSSVIKRKLTKVLKENGFKLGSNREIELSITTLEYNTKLGFISVPYYVDFGINLVVKDNNDNIKYYNNFQERMERNSFLIAPLANQNAFLINQVISSVLNKALSDQKFLKSLTK